ncbi:MAG: cbb3-type cytochrome oxidase assembly protein CcoS [Planctomycetota bacterium]
MSAIWIVLPLALVFAGIAVGAFIWTVKSGQLDDLDTPAVRPLVDDAEEPRVAGRKAEPSDHAEADRG